MRATLVYYGEKNKTRYMIGEEPIFERKYFRKALGSALKGGLVACIAFCGAGAKKAMVEGLDDAIVSEKDAVQLVSDASVAEAIDRRPDLSFANVTIDGQDSNISLDSISADSVSSVEVLKAVTPDQDADSRGGSISLKSKPAYEQSTVTTKIGLEAVYDSLSKALGYEGNVTIGGPLNRQKTLGGRLSLSWEDRPTSSQFILNDWIEETVDGRQEFVLKEVRLFHETENRLEQEVGASIDFKASDALSLFARANYAVDEKSEQFPHLEYRFNQGAYVSVDELGAIVENAEIERGFHADGQEEDEIEAAVAAEYTRGDWQADLTFTYQDELREQTDFLSADFVMSDVDLQYDLREPRFPQVTSLNRENLQSEEMYLIEDYLLRDRLSEESDSIISANARWMNPLGSENFYIRFGVKKRIRDRLRENEYGYYDANPAGRPFSLADVVSNEFERDILEGRYQLDPLADGPKLLSMMEQRADLFEYDERRSRERSDFTSYQVDEQVDAYYSMASLEFGKWRGLVGYRQEETSISFNSKEVLLGQDIDDRDDDGDYEEIIYLGTSPTYGENNYSNAFPNAHIRYAWNDRTTFIASYTNTIDRPSYGEVVPYRSVDLEDRKIREGNPNLMPTLYRNLDMSVDLKLGDEGLMSLEVFDRVVDDFIFSNKSLVSGGLYDGFELNRRENSASAKAQGVELTWSQPIRGSFIPDGLSVNANYIQQKTELEYPSRPDEVLPMAYHPDNRLRLAINYQMGKLFAQLKVNREGDKIMRITETPSEDRYRLASNSMDLMVSYRLQDKTRLYLEWDNLTNEPSFDNYEGHASRSVGYKYRPYTFATGVKMEL